MGFLLRFGLRTLGCAALFTACGEPPIPAFGVVASGSFVNAAQLAIEDARSEPSFVRFEVVVVREGTARSEPALRAAAELVAIPGIIGVVGHSNSAASLATARVYNEHRVTQIAPTSTAAIYSEMGPYSFRLVPPDSVQGAFLARTVADSFPEGARVALLYVNDAFGRGLRREVLRGLDPDRYPVVLDLSHSELDVSAFDVRHQVDAVTATSADLLLWLGRVPPLALLGAGLQGEERSPRILGSDAIAQVELMTERPPWWEQVWFSDFFDPDGSSELRAFGRRFTESFQGRAGTAEALTYDAVRLLLDALVAGARSGEEVRAHLESLGRTRPPFPGITGPISFSETGDLNRSFVLRGVPPPVDPR